MITIRVSILVAFSLRPKPPKTAKLKSKSKSKSREKKGKKSKRDKSSSKKGKRKPKEPENVPEKPKYLIEVEKPVQFCHIEYELIPERLKYQVDVVCWGPVAKVFSADDEITLKTFVANEKVWIPISVRHVFNQLDDAELFRLHRFVANCTFWIGSAKLGKKAKSENTKAFFIREEDIDSTAKFTEAYNTDPNLEKCEDEEDKRLQDLEKEIKSILWECADTPGTKNYGEVVTRLEFLKDPLHRFRINKIIDQLNEGRDIECKDFVPVCPAPFTDEDLQAHVSVKNLKLSKKKGKVNVKPSKTKKSKKSEKSSKSSKSRKGGKGAKKQKKAKREILKVEIPGEVFFTDPEYSVYKLRIFDDDLSDAFVITTVKNLLTRPQKYSLNPLIIKVKKLSNLPVDLLKDHRFTNIYAYYNVPYIARCSTIEKPIANTIKFNEAHAYFTDAIPQIKLLEFMQTQRLYIEIRGVREEFENFPAEPRPFGLDKNHVDISKRLTPEECTEKLKSKQEPTTVTLAVACYDISSLLKPAREYLEKAPCHHPETMCFQPPNSMYERVEFTDTITTNELNLNAIFKPKKWSPLSESALMEPGMTLKVEVHLSAPYNALLEVSKSPHIYHRMFVVINDTEFTAGLINVLLLHNQEILGPEVLVSNITKYYTKQFKQYHQLNAKISKTDPANFPLVITGFLIDNGNSHALFLEGLASGLMSRIWNSIMQANRPVLKAFYNSDFCFEKRLYPDFFKFGGVELLCLKVPLETILSKEGMYLEGNMPIPCWRALRKLNLLLKCTTMRTMTQYCLFPTVEELMSLNLEWGIPFRWKAHGSVHEILKNKDLNKKRGSSTMELLPIVTGGKQHSTQINLMSLDAK